MRLLGKYEQMNYQSQNIKEMSRVNNEKRLR